MIPLDEARAHVIARCRSLSVETRRLAGALGCVLAADHVAPGPVPPFANSSMDGYAVRAADVAMASMDTPVVLDVVGTLNAGVHPDVTVAAGQAVRIMTGAPLPRGADAVVMVELTRGEPGGSSVEILDSVDVGDFVRPAGDDLAAGSLVARAGTVLSPAVMGLLASTGTAEVDVYRRPRIGIMSTGDELVDAPAPLEPGQIHEANRVSLAAMVTCAGYEAVDLGIIADDDEAIAGAIMDGAAECDALLTSGGVSMGDVDLVKVVLDRLGDMRWMQVAIRPAKPLAFGVVEVSGRSVPVFGLPGNPVSSMVSFEMFVRPALRLMAGHGSDDLQRPRIPAVAAEEFGRCADGKLHLVMAAVEMDEDGRYRARPAGTQGSHRLTTMARADALAWVPDGEGVGGGDRLELTLLG